MFKNIKYVQNIFESAVGIDMNMKAKIQTFNGI